MPKPETHFDGVVSRECVLSCFDLKVRRALGGFQ